ncbi:MAG: hypothetical protein J6V90_10065 [Treponema sp.]|nr:hypothetical protein [Treponema sp.]
MKKVCLTLAALFAAAFFFSCSNGSDSVNPVNFPPVVLPINEFSGKTFVYADKKSKVKLSFTLTDLTVSNIAENPAVDGINTAYTIESVIPYSYSYDSTTKQIIYKYNGSTCTEKVIRNGTSELINDQAVRTFKDDADFFAYQSKRFKAMYDLLDAASIDARVKKARWTSFSKYGYADDTGETEVSAEIIEKYNKVQTENGQLGMNAKNIYAYELSGSTLKIKSDTRVPAGKSLKEVYDSFSIVVPIGNDYSMRKKKATQPDISPSNSGSGLKGYKVSSVTDSEIIVSGEMTLNSSGDWDFTANEKAFNYTTTKTDTSATYVVETLGTINLDYASASNVPDMADALVCTLE